MVDYAVPSCSDLIRAFGCSVAEGDRVVEILKDAADDGSWRAIHIGLEQAAEVLGWTDAYVRPMEFSITHPEGYGEYATERCGTYVEADSYEATLAYCYGDYLAREQTYDQDKRAWVPTNRKEGFYITAWADELESFEGHFTNGMTKRELHDYTEWLGPRDDDLVTADYRRWYHYMEGRQRNRWPEAFSLNLRETRKCPQCGSDDTYVDRWDDKGGGKYPWECSDCSFAWLALAAPFTLWEDDPESFYDDHEDAIWRMIAKYQDKQGYYGNVWKVATGRHDGEMKLLDPPKSGAWNQMEPWRAAFRQRKLAKDLAKKRAELGPVRSPERRRVGLPMPVTKQHGRVYTASGRRRQILRQQVVSRRFPTRGDLYHRGKGASGEVYFYRVGSATPALVVTQREIDLGIAVEKVRRAARNGVVWRWRGPDANDWTPVVLDPRQGFAGLAGKRRRR